ncbi:MAG: hypothetical protein ACO2ZL_00265 [Flavobacteriales bacterium]
METGGINQSNKANLILGWDGVVLRWICSNDGRVEAFGQVEEVAEWTALAERFKDIEKIILTRILPEITLMPATVAEGIEEAILTLHHGIRSEGCRAFLSQRLGEELSLIEGGHGHEVDLLNTSWPTGRWSSSVLGWLESRSQWASTDQNAIAVNIFVGSSRALMCRFDAGSLAWCTVTDDLEGSGVLYHCVNAMVRDGIKIGSSNVHVRIGGVQAMSLELEQQFKRFFGQVEVESSPWDWNDANLESVGDWDILFFTNH